MGKFKLRLVLLIFVLCFASCAKDELSPLYGVDPLKIKPPVIDITTKIDLQTIPENGVSSFFDSFFGWIPVFGSLYEMPLDLVRVVLPPLSSKQFPHLPDGADWRNPALFKRFSSVKLKAGYIRAPGEEEAKARLAEAGQPYHGEKCRFLIFFCGQPGVEFLRQLRLYIVFGDDLTCMDDKKGPCPKDMKAQDVMLAHSDLQDTKFYHKDQDGTEWISFAFENADLRPYFDKYKDFRVKVIAEGKPPTREAYIEGALTIELVLAN